MPGRIPTFVYREVRAKDGEAQAAGESLLRFLHR